MAVICPTVTAFDPHEYREQIERLESFARRIHIDLMDGVFAPTQSPPLEQIWLPEKLISDIHLMYQKPMNQLPALVKLKPNLVVIHYEAEVDHAHFATHLRENGIQAGLAILQDTSADEIFDLLQCFDHVLVFSGDLGHHGGTANLDLLAKVRQIRDSYPTIEISWDGGITGQNARQLADAGIDVLNIGGFIQRANQPQEAYAKLEMLLKS